MKAVKKILHAGSGTLPQYDVGTKVFFHYETLLPLSDPTEPLPESREDYRSIDDTRKAWPNGYGQPLELVLGKKFQLPIFEAAIRTMLIDEISQFDVDASELHSYPIVSQRLRDIAKSAHTHDDGAHEASHHGHHCAAMASSMATGYAELDSLMQHPRALRFIFHLLRVLQPEEYEAESWQLDAEQRLASVETLRACGNRLAAEGAWQDASMKYREALGRLDTLLLREKPGDPEWISLDQQNITLYLNLAQCYLSLGNNYEAIEAASEALKRDPTNLKGLYRRAKAHIAVWNFDEACNDLKQLEDSHPSSANLARTELARIQQLRVTSEKASQDTFRAMFKGSQA